MIEMNDYGECSSLTQHTLNDKNATRGTNNKGRGGARGARGSSHGTGSNQKKINSDSEYKPSGQYNANKDSKTKSKTRSSTGNINNDDEQQSMNSTKPKIKIIEVKNTMNTDYEEN